MSNPGVINIKPALTFRPLSPFLAMLIESACRRLQRPEELAPLSLTQPKTIAPGPDRLDRTV